jgi:hypothetical protein
VGVPVEGTFRIEPVTILRTDEGGGQHGMRVPAIAVPVGAILLVAAGLVLEGVDLQVFFSLAEGGVELLLGWLVGVLGSAGPLAGLRERGFTTQPGCGVWSSLLPYLWLEASLDLSTRASRVILKPVVARPDRLALMLGSARTDLVMLA